MHPKGPTAEPPNRSGFSVEVAQLRAITVKSQQGESAMGRSQAEALGTTSKLGLERKATDPSTGSMLVLRACPESNTPSVPRACVHPETCDRRR